MSLQVIPNVPEEKLYGVVDEVIAFIESTGVKHVVGPMETTMEGELRELLEIVARAQEVCFQNGATRVISVVKIDCKPGGVTIAEKLSKHHSRGPCPGPAITR